ncbi:MAG: calcium/sodium antiporter [Kaistella sp.]
MLYILFVLGFIILIKGADLLVSGASAIAKKFNIPDLVIGLTIVAFGTSAPELFVNVSASMKGNTDIAVGNIIGSNIANILLILGVSAMIYPLTVKSTTVWKEIPFSLLAALVTGILANDIILDGRNISEISRGDGLILLAFFLIFLYYIFSIAKNSDAPRLENLKPMNPIKSGVFIAVGLGMLVLGGTWIITGAREIAGNFGVSEYLIGLTVVSVGTSLPELATSAVAAYKKNSEIAIGNVVGSNIFNVFWILGVSAVINPLPFQQSGNFDLMTAVLASVLLMASLFIGKRHILEKWQGALFLLIYVAYLSYIVLRG